MATTKRKQIALAAVVGLGLIALALDRFVLSSEVSGPAAAKAGVVSHVAAGLAAPVKVHATLAHEASIDGPSLAKRLEAMAGVMGLSLGEMSDSFQTPPAWRPQRASAAVGPVTPTSEPAEDFRLNHRLDAVVSGAAPGSGGGAIVNGKAVLIGQAVDGFTLVSLSQRSAVFEAQGVKVELQIQAQGSGVSGAN